MISQIIPKNEVEVSAMNKFMDQLYAETPRPKLSNVDEAEYFITVSSGGLLKGFVGIYLNPSFPQFLILGNFECVNEVDMTQCLFTEANNLAFKHGCSSLLGPMNGNTWFAYRYSIHLQTPFFMEAVHQVYYPDLWKKCGFSEFTRYQTNRVDFDPNFPLPPTSSYFSERGLTSRNFDLQNIDIELERLHEFCTSTFANNVLYSPISLVKFKSLYKPILPLLDGKLIDLAMDGDQIVGLLFAVKNLFNPKEVIIKTMARDPNKKYGGLANSMVINFYVQAMELGFESMINAYFHLDNKTNRLSQNFGGDMHQQYILLRREL